MSQTKTNATIRAETGADKDKITEVIDQAFAGKPYAGGDESQVVIRLRTLGVLSLSLVAEWQGEFAGHIAFSPVTAADGTQNWYALGPVAVYPRFQSIGIGGQLILTGLEQIKSMGAVGCMLTGNPVYYQRFGFEFSPLNCPINEQSEHFLLKRLTDDPLPEGPLAFHPAFYGSD